MTAALGGNSWVHGADHAQPQAAESAAVDPGVSLDASWSRSEDPVAGRHTRPGAVPQLSSGRSSEQGQKQSQTQSQTGKRNPGRTQSQAAPAAGTAGTPSTSGTSTSTSGSSTSSSSAAVAGASTANAPSGPPIQAPPPAAAAVVGNTSGAAMPSGNLPGWSLALAEDFNRTAALGTFAKTYRGWAAYDGGHDTTGNGSYNSATTMSVHDGMVDEYLHTEGGKPQVTALTPTPDGSWWSGQTHGRYSVRFRSDNIPGYKMAWLLWPCSDNWSEGEIDFPEGGLGGSVKGYSHDVTGNPSRNAFSVTSPTSMSDWHTATIEWAPGRVTYMLDGQTWSTTDAKAVPTNPMSWVLQTETNLDGSMPPASSAGHVYIDWVAAWRLA